MQTLSTNQVAQLPRQHMLMHYNSQWKAAVVRPSHAAAPQRTFQQWAVKMSSRSKLMTGWWSITYRGPVCSLGVHSLKTCPGLLGESIAPTTGTNQLLPLNQSLRGTTLYVQQLNKQNLHTLGWPQTWLLFPPYSGHTNLIDCFKDLLPFCKEKILKNQLSSTQIS